MTVPTILYLPQDTGVYPDWFSGKGMKMSVFASNPEAKFLRIAATAAWVEIQPFDGDDDDWQVKWHVKYSRNEYAEGVTIFTRDDLLAAFRLSGYTDPNCEDLRKSFLCESLHWGRFIRYEQCLNIPNPGLGVGYETSVSIWIDEEMQKAVLSLFE